MNSIAMFLAAPILSGLKSLASIEVETSISRTMSMPSVSVCSKDSEERGLAMARIISARAMVLRMNGICLSKRLALLSFTCHPPKFDTVIEGDLPLTSL